MSDRVLRDEIFESDRWLDLPSDSHRLSYIGLLPIADDFGNLEGGPRRVYRHLNGFTQIKTEADSIKVMSDLADADMVRRYEVDGREYWHLPRFTTHRQYIVRRCPPSPWDEELGPLGKEQRVYNRGHAKNAAATSRKRSNDVAQGVGVGVGVGEILSDKKPSSKERARPTACPPDFEISPAMQEWAQEQGIPHHRILPETEKFMDHARANGRTCVNWKAAWRNWLRKAKEMQPIR